MVEIYDILQAFSSGSYITAETLADRFKVSTKTIRMRIKEINDTAVQYGFSIESKPRYGYMLSLKEDNRLDEFLNSRQNINIPDNVADRINYLLAYLLNYNGYIKLDDLCSFLFVSRPTMQNTIKEVEDILEQYNLKIQRKPNYGITIVGEEFDCRRCIGDFFVKRNKLNIINDKYKGNKIKNIADIVIPMLQKYDIYLSETALETFLEQIYVALLRMKRGKYVSFERNDINNFAVKEWEFASELMEVLANLENLEIDSLTMQMLDSVNNQFKMDFRVNFEIRMMLNQHMVPLDIRIKYDIQSKNPLLDEIKSKYIMAYTIAAHASTVLTEHYRKKISESEIGYLALIFALAIEQNVKIQKTNILIVCSSGKGSSRLLAYKYKKEFGEYLNEIYVCDLTELKSFDFSKVSFVLTTVSIAVYVPKPVLEVGLFLGDTDRVAVRELFETGEKRYLRKYYKEDAFFVGIEGNNKEDILKNLCDRIEKQKKLPEGFYEAVLKREGLAQTDFGNFIAMPHPYKTMTEETLVYIAVLKEPVLWTKYEVQVIFLISVGTKEDSDLNKFYEDTTKLILKAEAVKYLIKNPEYEVLMDLLRQRQYHIE
ncbi:helix-turn-helix domain-containing protein [Clostridium boliviensis]|uniref:Helix-turn-helix domain-containing protein n=1 Tax=Clostridium boliviensis TaxID=318465 RepID=A0ABU4GGG0_9CLOT|nr:PTS sugar transporter subunit IIA [Clostridium boliviensis]MDW2796035.1 helix-turn-helix domain-containing protein [Clostridium boliviensis]